MPKLMSGDLAQTTLEDIRLFLRIDNSHEDQRPAEGITLDFKESLPQDLGSTVASFANTYGGLIFVGVKSLKKKQNIPAELPGADVGKDAQPRISDMILSTVYPRPRFAIRIVPGESTDKFVVVLHVQEGDFPPYQFVQGATVRIPVRVGDSDRQATVKEIEGLLGRRVALSASPEDIVGKHLDAQDFYVTRDVRLGPLKELMESREVGFHKLVVVPRVPFRVRVDSSFERGFEALVRRTMRHGAPLTRNFRRASLFQVERRASGNSWIHQIWRVWSDGSLGFVTGFGRQDGEMVGDLVADMLAFFRLARDFFGQRQYYGSSVFGSVIACPNIRFIPRFPPPDEFVDYDRIDGIHFPNTKPAGLPHASRWVENVEGSALADCEELVAEVILGHMLETWGANIKFDRLLDATRNLARQMYDAT
jgi:hypothetical protein